jgi:hypothetical protein
MPVAFPTHVAAFKREKPESMMVAALFVRKDSIYKTMPGVDAWDKDRDARNWPGGDTIVAHPPCAQWGRMSQWAHNKPAEKALALLALDLVDRWGGVVEHPVTSRLWKHCEGRPGWLYAVDQRWFGHRAIKRTMLYVRGITPRQLPPICYSMSAADQPVQNMGKAERERTPPDMANWLVETARRCSPYAECESGCDGDSSYAHSANCPASQSAKGKEHGV